jgi:hypothetical protein
MSIKLGCFVWANSFTTDVPLVLHWCKHYSSFPIDEFHIRLNAYGTEGDDLLLFSSIFRDNLPSCFLTEDSRPFNNTHKRIFLQDLLSAADTDILIPTDIDEFIRKDLILHLPEFARSSYKAMYGFCIDRSLQVKGKIVLKETVEHEPLPEQYPCMDKIRARLKKIVAVRYGEKLGSGHHRINREKLDKQCLFPKRIDVDHYCWTSVTQTNKELRPNSRNYTHQHSIFKERLYPVCEKKEVL